MKRVLTIPLAIALILSIILPVYATETAVFTNVYEDFTSYTYTDGNLISEYVPLNGGSGFDGAWYDNAEGGIAGPQHYFKNAQDSIGGADILTYDVNNYPLSRKLATQIDFSVPAEYYMSVRFKIAYQTSHSWMTEYNIGFNLGDIISFGAKAVNGKTAHDTSPYMYPFVKVGENSTEISTSTDDGLIVNQYHTMLAKITTDGNGNATVEVSVNGNKKLTLAGSGLTSADALSIKGVGAIRLHYISLKKFTPVNAQEDFTSYTYTDGKLISEYVPLNGGSGFDGAWYDNAEGGIAGPQHYFKNAQDSIGGADILSYDVNNYPLSRKLSAPVDFTIPAEYYMEMKFKIAYQTSHSWMTEYNIGFNLGDKLSFGAKAVSGKTAHDTSPYMYPFVKVGENSTEISTSTDDGLIVNQYHTMLARITTDGSGSATVKVFVNGKEKLSLTGSGLTSADALSIKGKGAIRIHSMKIEGYSKDKLDSIRACFSDTDEFNTILLKVNELGALGRASVLDEFNEITGNRYVYDGFESYADPTSWNDTNLKDITVNSGFGWSGAWYDNAAGTISGPHVFRKSSTTYPTAAYLNEIDLLAFNLSTYPLKRSFYEPIDFSKAGEYYLKVEATDPYPYDTLLNAGSHNICFSVGNSISFGNQYIADKSVPTTAPYMYPYLTVGDTDIALDTEDNGMHVGVRHEYVLKIIAKGNGEADVSLIIDGKIKMNVAATGLTTADYFEIGGSGGSIRVCDIFMERYSAEEVAAAREAIAKVGVEQMSYEDALVEVNKIIGFAYEYFLEDLNNSVGFVEVRDGKFVDADNSTLLNAESIKDSIYYSYKLYNNYISDSTVDVFVALYENGKLLGLKTKTETVGDKEETPVRTVGFDEIPTLSESGKLTAKVFVWQNGTYKPYVEKIEIPYDGYRKVTPSAFGDGTSSQITVAFMGDSITHMDPSYSKWIEYYYRLKYPEMNVKFINKGISGESCVNVVNRFDWDIMNDTFTGTPTDACLMIGMNDVQISQYDPTQPGTAEAKQTAIDNCLANIKKVVELCEENNVRLTLVTPTLYDEDDDYTTKANHIGMNEALSKVAEGVIEIANENNLPYIDFNGPLNRFYNDIRNKPEFEKAQIFNILDRVHLTDAGTFAAGFAFVNQQINDSVIASVDINADTLDFNSKRADVSNVSYSNGVLSYTYAPKSLPIGVTENYNTNETSFGIPVTDTINREIIKVSGLESGDYQLKFGDTVLGAYSSAQLESGINIATLEANPGQVQALELYNLLIQKTAKDSSLRNIAHAERGLLGYVSNIDFTNVEACIAYNTQYFGSSTEERYVKYAERKRAQAQTVSDIASLEVQMKTKSQPGVYNVQLIKQ